MLSQGEFMAERSEQELYQWLLTQRILHEAGLLEPAQVARLDTMNVGTKVPRWDSPLTDEDWGHALTADNPELNAAFEAWWNATGMSPEPMTFAEIKAKALAEM